MTTINLDEIFDKYIQSKADWYELYDKNGIYWDKKLTLFTACLHILRNKRLSNQCIIVAVKEDDEGDKQILARVRIRLSLTITKLPDEKEGA